MVRKILITGVAGFIGTHVVNSLLAEGWTKEQIIGVDDFRTSTYSRLLDCINFTYCDVQNVARLTELIMREDIETVIHLAGNRYARLSTKDPYTAYVDNLLATSAVSEAAKRSRKVKKIIFSSSCSVYGNLKGTAREDSPTDPVSPYGRSKLWSEQVLVDQWKSGGPVPIILRYFNVVGHVSPATEDRNPNGLVGAIIRAIETGSVLEIFGNNFETSDGTAVRDLVDVADVASAHCALLRSKFVDDVSEPAWFNLGSGLSVSVLQFISKVEAHIGQQLDKTFRERHPADPDIVQADFSRFRSGFNWAPRNNLESLIASIGFKSNPDH